jgi:hypothetical protein
MTIINGGISEIIVNNELLKDFIEINREDLCTGCTQDNTNSLLRNYINHNALKHKTISHSYKQQPTKSSVFMFLLRLNTPNPRKLKK